MVRLSEVVDIFKCCIFTWGALTTILPAFVIAGAIITFVPPQALTKYLGAGTKRYISYPIAAIAGAFLPACSCNIVPLFVSIMQGGAGIGPAFTFLYAGPAINIISCIFTFKVIGPLLGIWRIIGVLFVSITLGLIMERIFQSKKPPDIIAQTPLEVESVKKLRLFLTFGLLFAILATGASLTSPNSFDIINKSAALIKVFILFISLIALSILVATKFEKAELLDWLAQTFKLIKTIIPLFIISILVIGFLAKYVDVRWIHDLLAAKKDAIGNRIFIENLKSIFFGTIFGELMYFPILSEIAFTKAFLKLGMDVGPALAILLAGAGTSLPGFILIGRFVGWKKVSVYFVLSVAFELLFATAIAMFLGDYICACLNLK